MLVQERLRNVKQPTLELPETPALIDLCAGRITVDAREKDYRSYNALREAYLQARETQCMC
jgi:hypothetical protein